jgi:hypothetical protein
MAPGEDRAMSLTLKKVRGSDDYQFSWDDGSKAVSWIVQGNDVDPSTLLDIVNTAAPERMISIPPTIPAIPLWSQTEDVARMQREWVASVTGHNQGAEAADRAARDEEMRLRNMGSALASGVGLAAEDIPVVDTDRNDMGPVNWGV